MQAGILQSISKQVDALKAAMGSELVARFEMHFHDLEGLLNQNAQNHLANVLTQPKMTELQLGEALANRQSVIMVVNEPFFEDDWHEEGMVLRLTRAEWNDRTECFKIYTDGTGFEFKNFPLMPDVYNSNSHTERKVQEGEIPHKEHYSALDAGMYRPAEENHLSVMIGGKEYIPDDNDNQFGVLAHYLIKEHGDFYLDNA